ncbi:MAG: recombinase RecA [Candidatus Methanogaster sp.]|uniref:Recombinase RecA n=1 Tax=Candidatus Methanogaster sp. TaxID=3386292 RepID=A0AC61KYD0_9EURY|nr:MAG: recombinase RecA [ANME-2 cluster archaeon]
MTYKLGISRLDELIGDIKNGTNIMMIGPPISGKDDIANVIVCQGLLDANAAVIVSTREPGDNVLEWFEHYDPDIPMDRIGIVDCVTRTLGFGAHDTDNIKMASSPVDLTGIGVKISQFLEHFWMEMQLRETRLCINSLSTILMYSNLQTVFRFLHVFTGRMKAANALGIYVIEEGMHDEKTIVTLKQLFDGMIEIREGEEGYQIRAVGFTPKPTPWFDYEIDGANIVLQG